MFWQKQSSKLLIGWTGCLPTVCKAVPILNSFCKGTPMWAVHGQVSWVKWSHTLIKCYAKQDYPKNRAFQAFSSNGIKRAEKQWFPKRINTWLAQLFLQFPFHSFFKSPTPTFKVKPKEWQPWLQCASVSLGGGRGCGLVLLCLCHARRAGFWRPSIMHVLSQSETEASAGLVACQPPQLSVGYSGCRIRAAFGFGCCWTDILIRVPWWFDNDGV